MDTAACLVFLLGLTSLGTVSACNIQAVKSNCLNYDKISSEMPFFTSSQDLDDNCKILEPALECCLDTRYAEDCDALKLVKYQTNMNVISAICDKYRDETERSLGCLKAIEVSVTSSVRKVTDARGNFCAVIQEAYEGAVASAVSATQDCDTTAKWLIERTVFGFLQPVVELPIIDCDWKPQFYYEREDPTTPTTTTTTTTTTPPTTQPEVMSTNGTILGDIGAIKTKSDPENNGGRSVITSSSFTLLGVAFALHFRV